MTAEQIDHVATVDVVIDSNVRRTVDVDKSFVSSIRNHGILQPPVGWRDEAGRVHITMGQRRTLAAKEIGLDTIPVIIRTQTEAGQARIVAQLAENEQRQSLTPADTAAAYAQLQFEYGVSTEQIARKTNSPKAKVRTALTVAASEAATKAVRDLPLTLEQAAVFIEFEDDDEDLNHLLAAAASSPEQIDHVASRIREQRLDRETIDRLKSVIVDHGGQVADTWEEFEQAGAVHIARLWREDDPARKQLTPADVSDYAGVYGYIRPGYRGDDDRGFTILWGITNPTDKGLTGHSLGVRNGITKTDEQKAEAKQKRQDKADMIAATPVRRAWIRDTLLAPINSRSARVETSMLRWIARELWHAPGTLRPSNGLNTHLTLHTLLGIPETDIDNSYDSTTRDPGTGAYLFGEARLAIQLIEGRDPLRIALAAAVAQTEAIVGNPKADGFGQDRRAGGYLTQLAEWGYTLSDVEQRIVDAYSASVVAEAERAASEEK